MHVSSFDDSREGQLLAAVSHQIFGLIGSWGSNMYSTELFRIQDVHHRVELLKHNIMENKDPGSFEKRRTF
jgi:hypothetical protein